MVRKYQMIHNQMIPKVHQHGVSSCALHQYDLNGSATNMLHYHYQLCIFWHQYLCVSLRSRFSKPFTLDVRPLKSKIPNKKTEAEEEETTRVKTSRVSSFVILCSFFTQ